MDKKFYINKKLGDKLSKAKLLNEDCVILSCWDKVQVKPVINEHK